MLGLVLEVGCGPGQIGAFVRASGRCVAGLDLSPRMAALASNRLDAAVAGDMRSLPVADASLGGVVALYSIIHVRRVELTGVLRELRRVLRRGGRVLLSAHEGDGDVELEEFLDQPVPVTATFFRLDELASACRAVGLEPTLTERRQPYDHESGTVRLYVEAVRT